jgi:peptidoglycan hydrolase CwlO-like protein
MKVKLSEVKKVLIEQYKKGNISEIGLSGLLSKILPKSKKYREKENEIKELEKELKQIYSEMDDLLSNFPEISDEEEKELRKKLGIKY